MGSLNRLVKHHVPEQKVAISGGVSHFHFDRFGAGVAQPADRC